MEFILFIANPPQEGEVDSDEGIAPFIAWANEMDARGIRKEGQRLRAPEDATLVRRRNGELIVTDGPFSETKEWIDGFDIIECDDMDQAIEIAASHPGALTGRVDIRAVWPIDFEEFNK
jgi:hypothetical protein